MNKLEWNQELYEKIENKVNQNMPVLGYKAEYSILDEKYKSLIKYIEEEYLIHPDGPYKGSKSELKEDKEYTSKSLIKKIRKIEYYGDVIQKAINDANY